MRKLLLGSLALVAYTFVGYPLLLAAAARRRPRTPNATPPAFRVSLVIAALDEAAVIGDKLENCAALDYPAELLEVIVVADGSRDGTAALAREYPRTKVLFAPERRGKAAALRRGVAAATGDILVFSDANNRYASATLRELLAPFADPSVGVVTGKKVIEDASGRALDHAESLYWRYESAIKELESRLGMVTGVAGEVLAVRREALHVPAEGTVNDDFVLAMLAAAAGWRIAYAPGAVSVEGASATVSDEAERRARIVAGRWQALCLLLPRLIRSRPLLAWQVVSHKGLRPLIPFALATAAVTNAALVVRGSSKPLALLQASFYGAAVLGWWEDRRGERRRLFYAPYYLCLMNIAAVRGLVAFATDPKAGVWRRVRRATD